jgi:spore maturation protein CgeB
MGTYAADRQAKLESMFLEAARQRSSLRFTLAGSLYPPEWHWPSNVQRFEHVGPSDHAALYCSSRLTLNLTREEMAASGYCPSGRFFEAAACGAPIVTDWFAGLDSFFEAGQEVLVAGDTGTLLRALDSSDAELRRMARRARQRTLDEHTGRQRALTMLAAFDAAGSPQIRNVKRSAQRNTQRNTQRNAQMEAA